MIFLKQLIYEVKYDHGCVMAQIPPQVASQLMTFGKQIISDDMLYFDPQEPDDYGREKDPHITIKFGLTQPYTPQQMTDFLKEAKPFFIRILGMDVFSNSQFDVVKMNVEGEELRRLRQIFDKLPNVDDHPVYQPHLTLAYVKPGVGKAYQNRTIGKFARVPISQIVYSDRGKKSSYQL